jgi:hypothetical protein
MASIAQGDWVVLSSDDGEHMKAAQVLPKAYVHLLAEIACAH